MNDIISREAAKKYIDAQIDRVFFNGCSIAEAMKMMIDEIPSEERTVKVTDTWTIAGYSEINAWCPECEHRITRGCSYCPTCGVKLDWSGNETD